MEDGVERIVEQVVNPKIMSVIQPEVFLPLINNKINPQPLFICQLVSITHFDFRWKAWFVVCLTLKDSKELVKQVKMI